MAARAARERKQVVIPEDTIFNEETKLHEPAILGEPGYVNDGELEGDEVEGEAFVKDPTDYRI